MLLKWEHVLRQGSVLLAVLAGLYRLSHRRAHHRIDHQVATVELITVTEVDHQVAAAELFTGCGGRSPKVGHLRWHAYLPQL